MSSRLFTGEHYCPSCRNHFVLETLEPEPAVRRWTLGDQAAEDDPQCKRFAGIEVD